MISVYLLLDSPTIVAFLLLIIPYDNVFFAQPFILTLFSALTFVTRWV